MGSGEMNASFDRGGRRRRSGGIRRTGVRFLAVAAAAAFMLLVPSGGYAVHDLGLFELDTAAPQFANTADNSGPGAPYDWESIFNASGQQTLTSAAEPRLLAAQFS